MSMDTVRVGRIELLSKIRDNRKIHLDEYEASVVIYKDAVLKWLGEVETEAAEHVLLVTNLEPHEVLTNDALDTQFYCPATEPFNKLRDYDRVIGMLEMCVDDTIELTVQEYNNYILDEWVWKNSFVTGSLSNTVYLAN